MYGQNVPDCQTVIKWYKAFENRHKAIIDDGCVILNWKSDANILACEQTIQFIN